MKTSISLRLRRYREGKKRDKEFRTVFLNPGSPKSPANPQITEILRSGSSSPDQQPPPSPFFGLPPALRRDILVLALGGRTLHMHLDYQHPFALRRALEFEDSFEYVYFPSDHLNQFHARVQNFKAKFADRRLDRARPKEWQWFGCVCHRSPPPGDFGIEGLSCGRARSRLDYGRELDEDGCMRGAAACTSWPGEWPHKCRIGVTGWLLASRQAYLEGMDALYRTNTIHISSPPLLRGLHTVMSEMVLQHLTSLEVVWDPDQVPLAEGFASQTKSRPLSTTKPGPIFPYLMFLRVAFKPVEPGAVDAATGLVWPYQDVGDVEARLRTRVFPAVGDLLHRAVPSTTHVTVSCPDHAWFRATCDALKAKEAKGAAPHVAEIGGLQVWWPVEPSKAFRPRTPDPLLGRDAAGPREGFWVHIAEDRVDFEDGEEVAAFEYEDCQSPISVMTMGNPFQPVEEL